MYADGKRPLVLSGGGTATTLVPRPRHSQHETTAMLVGSRAGLKLHDVSWTPPFRQLCRHTFTLTDMLCI